MRVIKKKAKLQRVQVLGENKTSIGNISSRPISISAILSFVISDNASE